MTDERLQRNIEFFGQAGQDRLRSTKVAVVGVGGLGTHVVQQVALLGVGGIALIDSQELELTNRNRYIGAWHDDPIPGSRKVVLGARMARLIDPNIQVETLYDSLVSESAFQLIKLADFVIGSLDCEGARLILTELCSAYGRPYIDAATDIDLGPPFSYGGRVCCAMDGNGCLVCQDVIDIAEAQLDLAGPQAQRERDAIYGVARAHLGRWSGTFAKVSANGSADSLAELRTCLEGTVCLC